MKFASLFSGAGGLDLGLQQAGHEVILQCEVDTRAREVLKQHFPGTLLVPDICSLESLPKETELVTAGFPCVDVSRAGHRAGLYGQRTSLVNHVFRLLETAKAAHRPVPWVLLENVEAILDRIHGNDPAIKHVTDKLQQLGYASWAHRVINTAGFGLPQSRRRLFLLAAYHGDARDVLLAQGVGICRGSCKHIFNGTPCFRCAEPTDAFSTFALDMGNALSAPTIDYLPTLKTGNSKLCLLFPCSRWGLLRVEDAERAQGFPEGWTLCQQQATRAAAGRSTDDQSSSFLQNEV